MTIHASRREFLRAASQLSIAGVATPWALNLAAIGSAYGTNEDNYVFARFAADVLGTKHIDFMRHEVPGDEDAILIRADKSAGPVQESPAAGQLRMGDGDIG